MNLRSIKDRFWAKKKNSNLLCKRVDGLTLTQQRGSVKFAKRLRARQCLFWSKKKNHNHNHNHQSLSQFFQLTFILAYYYKSSLL